MINFRSILFGLAINFALFAQVLGGQAIYYSTPLLPEDLKVEAGVSDYSGVAVVVAGGHVTEGDSLASPDNSIRLSQSSIGFIAATTQGYPGSFSVVAENADDETNRSVRYRLKTDGAGVLELDEAGRPLEITDGNFKIEGTTGKFAYDESTIISALDDWRLAIRLNPISSSGYVGVVRATRERMMARIVLAYEDYLESTRFRNLPPTDTNLVPGGPGSTIDLEIASLLDAREKLLEALDLFVGLARDPVEGIYLQPVAPFGLHTVSTEEDLESSALAEETARTFDTYIRSLALVTEIEERYQRVSYLREYEDPLTDDNPLDGIGTPLFGPGSPSEMAARATIYDGYLSLAAGFTHCASYAITPINRVQRGISQLQTLKKQSERFQVSFTPGSRLGTQSTFAQTAFGPYYVPFLTNYTGAASTRTYENLLFLLKQDVLPDAITAEANAKEAIETVILNNETIEDRALQALIDYNGRLIDLCGTVPGPDGGLVPDLKGYLFPPELRLEVTGEEGSGAVLSQYKRIEIAETNYRSAVQGLEGLLQRIDITEQGAAERAGVARQNGQSLARIYTKNGEEFALLDRASSEISAQAERDAARERAKAHKQGFFSRLASVVRNTAVAVGGVIAAPATGGGSLAATAAAVKTAGDDVADFVSEVSDWSGYNKEGRAIMAAAEVRAKASEAQGKINEQRTRLRAAESAEVAIVNASGQAIQIELAAREEIRKLYVEVERAKLNILMAEQELDLAELELVNLIEKVGYTLDEYEEVARQVVGSPLNRPDYRYVRDYQIQFAEDQFRRAQMWTYLTLKSAQYRFMTSGNFEYISDLIETTLKSRNATELDNAVVNALDTLGTEFYLENGFAADGALISVGISLRDEIFQSNNVSRDAGGDLAEDSGDDFLPLPESYGETPETASDAQWLEILQNSIEGMVEGTPVLRLRFSTSFDPRGTNPLHNQLQAQLGHVILSSGGDGTRKGVFVNLRGFEIPNDTYFVTLRQVGTTYLTYRPRSVNGEPNPAWSGANLPVRIWNLPPRAATFRMALNQSDNNAFIQSEFQVPKVSAFDERSPYCDEWELIIDGRTPGSPEFELLTDHLDAIRDIRIGMNIQGFDPNQIDL